MQSVQRVVSDGTLKTVDLSIRYFDRSEINVYVNSAPYTNWRWASAVENRIIFNSPIPAGAEVLIKRTTDLSKLRHYFSKGSAFTAEALDEDLQQVLHIAQEATEANLAGNFFTDIDMHGHKIKNVGPATADNEVVTLSQYRQDAQGAFVARNQAEQFKNEAASYASSARTSANNSAASAQDSSAAAGRAQTYAANAASSASAAAQSANNAASSASAAAQSANNAASSASAAAQSANNAASSASAAAQSANNAASSASAAAQSANNAASSASAAAQSANNAAASASAAAQSANNAAASASAAAQSANNAASSASAAAQSATNAAASASAAAQSATNAAASFDGFNNRYLGAKPRDPATDNNGNALQVGALYWNTTVPEMRVWNGASWRAAVGSLVGNADTATRLQNPRTLTIGNTGKSFDGSANVSWSLDEILGNGVPNTAQPLGSGVDLNTIKTPGFYVQPMDGGAASGTNYPIPQAGSLVVLQNAGVAQIYYAYGGGENPRAFFRTFYSYIGKWSPWREFYHSGNIDTANAGTATKLQTARTITIGNTGKSFDGSADVAWSLAEILGNGVPNTAQRLGSGVDLDTIKTPGFYVQPLDGGAASGTNYPIPQAGSLVVIQNAGVAQIYYAYGGGENPRAFFRTFYGYLGKWSPWREFYHSGNIDTITPPGMVAYFARNTAPAGWLKANGAAVSRTAYAALFEAIGTTFGAGDGSTTFNLPDLRGEFIRGWDDGRGVDSGRGLGRGQNFAMERITGQFTTWAGSQMPSGAFFDNGARFTRYSGGSAELSFIGVGFDSGRVVSTANETRPRNIALLACIKY